MKVIFLGDAHLEGTDDPNQSKLCEFLGELTSNAEPASKLVIMGDLFIFWTGFKGSVYERYRPVLDSLIKVKERGTEIIYVEGNHDFSMGPFFTNILDARVITNCGELDIDGERILLCHGDAINMVLPYRIWRWFIRSPLASLIKMIATPKMIYDLGFYLSNKSRTYSTERTKVVDKRLRAFARRHISEGFSGAIMGHSHMACFDSEEVNGKKGFYANSGSWMDGDYILYNDGKYELKKY